jgi:hypothetical protein
MNCTALYCMLYSAGNSVARQKWLEGWWRERATQVAGIGRNRWQLWHAVVACIGGIAVVGMP